MGSFVSSCKNCQCKLPARSVDRGQDRKIPPAPGTKQIAGFSSSCPLTSQEKNKYTLFDGLTYNTRGYFVSCAAFFRTPKGRGKIRAISKMSARIVWFQKISILPMEGIFPMTPPLWKFQFSFIHCFKVNGSSRPPPPWNFQSLLWGRYGYFLEPRIIF